MPIRLSTLLIVFLVNTLGVSAQSPQNQGNNKPPLRLHGFLLGNLTSRTRDAHPPGKEGGLLLWADGRLRTEISGDTASGKFSFLFKGDVFHDAVAKKPNGLVREAYLDYSQGWFDLRAGRQIVTWGVGDFLFINDVFPKDWNAFFSGRPTEYLKVGVDAAKLRMSTRILNAELMVIPFFKPDSPPNPQRFFFFDPFADVHDRRVQEPVGTAGNAELALRLYRRLFQSDVSLYAYEGYWRQPSLRPDRAVLPTQLRGSYPRLAVYGASAQKSVGADLLSLEAGYYDSRDDRQGVDPAIPNSQFRFLVGYQRELTKEFTLAAQYDAEVLKDYETYKKTLAEGLPEQDHVHHLLTVRLTRLLKYQTWKLSLFTFYSPSDQDTLMISEIWHAITDRLSVTIGANAFAGQRQTTFLGQFDRNDNLYVVLRFDF